MKSINGRWTPAAVAIILTMMRKHGLVEKIDEACTFDRDRRVLTPGEAVLLIIGATALRNRRIPLYKIGRQYESMNIKGILGREVGIESLSDTALSRALDTVYKADRTELYWNIANEIARFEGLDSRVFHLDQTKIRTYVVDPPECDENAAKPIFSLDKEGRLDFRVYSASAMTDENGILRYIVPHDGNESDPVMDEKAIDYLVDAVDPKECTVVTDSKGTNSILISKMGDAGLGFVSKVPVNYSCCLRSRVIHSALDCLRQSKTKRGHAFADFDMMVENSEEKTERSRKVRCVAFTSMKMRRDTRAALIKAGMKDAEKASKNLNKQRFLSMDDALLTIGKVQEDLASKGVALHWELQKETVRDVRHKRGRIPKDEKPTFHEEWYFESDAIADDEMADIITERTAFQVLITNLPRVEEGKLETEDVREGASSETVLKLYLNQFLQEHVFALLKGRVGLANVYVSKPERANAMMFVLGLAALMRNIINANFKRDKGIFTTAEDMIDRWDLVRIRESDGEMEIDGGGDVEREMYDVMRRLGMDEGTILQAIAS